MTAITIKRIKYCVKNIPSIRKAVKEGGETLFPEANVISVKMITLNRSYFRKAIGWGGETGLYEVNLVIGAKIITDAVPKVAR